MQLDPNNVSVLRQMGSLYRKNGQWQQFGQTLTRALDVATTDVDRKEILTDLGELLERQMNEVDQGLAHYTRALEIDPLHLPALEALERMYTARSMNRELCDVLGRKVKALKENDEIASHKLRIAALYENKLDDLEKAAQTYREVLDVDGASLAAMRGLERIYTQKSSWAELVNVLEQELDVVTSERERIDVLMKLATIQEEQFLKAELAAARLEQVLEIDPSHEPALVALERCYRRLRQWLDLINAYERHINTTLERSAKVELYGAMAQVYADEVEDLDRAIDAYRNIVDIDDANIPALEALSKLFEKQGDAAQAIDYMTRVADLTADGKQRVEMYYRIGKALDEKLGDRVRRKSATRWRSISIRRTFRRSPPCGRSPSTRPTGIARRATSIKSSSTPRLRGSAPGCSSSSASFATRRSASTRRVCRPTSLPSSPIRTTRTRRFRF